MHFAMGYDLLDKRVRKRASVNLDNVVYVRRKEGNFTALLIVLVVADLIHYFLAVNFSNRVGLSAMLINYGSTAQYRHRRFADIFRLSRYADVIRNMDGYGDKSCENLMAAIEKSRHTDPVKLIVSMSIPLIGSDAAQRFIRTLGWQGFLQRLEEGTGFDDLNGIGPERSNSVLSWYADAENRTAFRDVLSELTVENVEPSAPAAGTCAGLTFVITGDVHIFRNRDEFKAYVEQQGGKVAGSVSGKTSFLVNNDAASQSSKNRKAAELGVPVITEDEFIARFGR